MYGILAVIDMYNDSLPSAVPSINSMNKSRVDPLVPSFSITTVKLVTSSTMEYTMSLNLATTTTNDTEKNGIQAIQIIHIVL